MLGREVGDNTVIRNAVKYLPAEKVCHSRRLEFTDESPVDRQNCKEAKPEI